MLRILIGTFTLYRKIVKRVVISMFKFMNFLPRGRWITTDILEEIWRITTRVRIEDQTLKFHAPNWLTRYRATSILDKEPETISWIKSMPEGSVLWDVGANVGTFSIYAALRNIRVVAVEPSFMNIEILNRNLISNSVTNLVTVIPFGVGDETSVLDFYMTPQYFTWGGAHNSIGSDLGSGGKPISNPIKVRSLSYRIDELVRIKNLPRPTHIKIDVDGHELSVLEGSIKTLEGVQSVLVEVDHDFPGQAEAISQVLSSAGFTRIVTAEIVHGAINQIWKRL